MYRKKEELILREKILASGLVSEAELSYIKNLYCEFVPYHNFIHALKVAQCVLSLPLQDFSIIEIKSLFIAALFHDAGHRGTAGTLDEFRSLDMAIEGILDFEKLYNYEGIHLGIVRKSIIGTVFKNRAKNKNLYALILADMDIATVGMNFLEFVFYADFPMMEELGYTKIRLWLQNVEYFKFLLSVEKKVFRTSFGQNLFPHALKNMKLYCEKARKNDIRIMYLVWKKSISYDDFFIRLEKKLPNLHEYL